MSRKWNLLLEAATTVALLLGICGMAAAQYPQSSQSQQPAQSTEKPKTPESTPLTLDATPPPVSAEEDTAFKAYQDAPPSDWAKKIELGEAFVQKYPQSRYLPPIYSGLTIAYMQTNQIPKMLDIGDKAVELTPTDVTTLAILSQTISRVTNSNTPNSGKLLDKAESYSKKAIEVAPTLPKPPNLTDEAFASAKNQALAAAHSGLGLVYVKRGKNAEAIPELEASVKMDPNPDPVNYYLLGMANKGASHFDDAIAAFNKCAALTSSLQATCKAQADDTKKKSATELSAPK
ncbi:MAG TPA: tetratricopeptide repeat protein [Candidatus Acidoferrum sp.]|jgi:tetratricopeptide (TPR) repeat protein|nr:tetratricopeptide repeat protein [Candidatus Acidoferrum sp.]